VSDSFVVSGGPVWAERAEGGAEPGRHVIGGMAMIGMGGLRMAEVGPWSVHLAQGSR
jgi:hypothetical protein